MGRAEGRSTGALARRSKALTDRLPIRTLVLAACALTLAGADPSGAATAAPAPLADAVPGQLIVRFERGVEAAERARARRAAGVTLSRRMLLPGTELVTASRADPARALEVLNDDRRVRYAEANLVLPLAATPNDSRFGEQWGLRNTGQSVNSIAGVPGADIAAEEAWELTTGARSVLVAVVDTGLSPQHPDLARNLWRNAGDPWDGVDNDANGVVDDYYGWDFFDQDPDVTPTDYHGMHVAGIVGADGDNSLGVTGVNWQVSIAMLRACNIGGCPLAAATDAIVHAGQIGADVANLSFGGPSRKLVLDDAIAASQHTLFVAAAGNGASDLEVEEVWPCEVDAPNLLCVAASDQTDQLADFSNWGVQSVDLAAPGANVVSTYAGFATPFLDDFEALAQWDYDELVQPRDPARWRRQLAQPSLAPPTSRLIDDSDDGIYPANANTTVTMASAVDLSGYSGCDLQFRAKRATERGRDFLLAEVVSDGTDGYIEVGRWSGTMGTRFLHHVADLSLVSGDADVRLRFRLVSDGSNSLEGVQLDDVGIDCDDPADSYGPLEGTSMAAPHVAGAAALIKAVHPDASVEEMHARILKSVDDIPSLSEKTVTGGRLNVAQALTADVTAPSVMIDEAPLELTSSRTAHFGFSSSDASATFQCRLDGAAFEVCLAPKSYEGLVDGEHLFEVRAVDTAGNVGEAAEARWTVDATAPTVAVTAGPADPTPERSASFGFEASEPAAAFECRLDGGGFGSCVSPRQYDGLPDGEHLFEVRAMDAAGNASGAVGYRWVVDTEPPAVVVDGGPSALTSSRSAALRFSSPDGRAGFECRLDGGGFESCVSPRQYDGLSDGEHLFEVRAVDTAGNVSGPVGYRWVVDTESPVVVVDGGPSALTSSRSAAFGFSSPDGGAGFECRLDAGGFESCVSPRQYDGLPDGEHLFEVRATDPAGNVGEPVAATWVVDATAPTVAISAGPPDSTSEDSATFGFEADGQAGAFECSLDGAPFAGCTSPAAYEGLAVGAHSFSVRARDAAGNWSEPASRSWTVTEPTADADPDGGGSGGGSSDGGEHPPADGTGDSGGAGEPDSPAVLQPPDVNDPEPRAWGAPRLRVAVRPQALARVLRRGFRTRSYVRGRCPCRIGQALRLDRRLARRVGLVASGRNRGRVGPSIGRTRLRLDDAGRVRTTIRVNKRARKRLRKQRRVDGWLQTTVKDERGLATILRQQLRLRR